MVNNKMQYEVVQMKTNKNLPTQYCCEILVSVALLNK